MHRLAILNSHPIQYFAPLYKRISQEPDIDLTVYYCSHQGLEEYIDPGFGEKVQWDTHLLDGYKAKFLPNIRQTDKISDFFTLINPSIIIELWRGKYDALIVHGHNYATYLMAIVVAKLCRTPIFMRCETHLLLKRSPQKQWLRKYLMTIFYHICDICLPIGTRNTEFYHYHGVHDNRLFLVHYTVDNDFFRQAADQYNNNVDAVKCELGIPADKIVILYASKLIERKRAIDLLMAFKRLRATEDSVILLFVGSGAEEATLRHYVSENQIPDVFFFGFQNQSVLPKFYACADIFVLPSENEPWGLVINEVMATGVPVIATDEIGAVADLIVHGFNGFVYPTGNIDLLHRYLYILAKDEVLRNKFADRAKQIMNTWSYEQCVTGIRNALLHIANLAN